MSAFDAYIRLDGTLKGTIRCDESMARHTTYRIGGPAALYITCASVSDLTLTLEVLAEEGVDWRVCGKGSNLLVADEGYDGAVIVLGEEFGKQDFCGYDAKHAEDVPEHVDGQEVMVTAGAATLLSRLVQKAYGCGLSGLEFAVGIPGTFGGALFMNAGTRDVWMNSIVESVTTYKAGTGLSKRRVHEIAWAYRRGGFAKDEVIVEASVRLTCADNMMMRAQMETVRKRRQRVQPLDMPSCGSVFRNPEGASAGDLIESCGLKGMVCGGAQISEKHANFIVNTGSASAHDVVELMQIARSRVKEAHGIELQPEVKFLGFAS